MTLEDWANFSNYAIASATAVLALAWLASVAQWAFGSQAVRAERSLDALGEAEVFHSPGGRTHVVGEREERPVGGDLGGVDGPHHVRRRGDRPGQPHELPVAARAEPDAARRRREALMSVEVEYEGRRTFFARGFEGVKGRLFIDELAPAT